MGRILCDRDRPSDLTVLSSRVPQAWHGFRYSTGMTVVTEPVDLRAATDPDGAAKHGWRARLSLAFERRGDRTVLASNRHFGPLRLQKPLYPEGDGVCHAIVLHPPAGIVGGDCLDVSVAVGRGAHALLTTPGAGKWYRSDGRTAQLSQRLAVEKGAVCEWLPQESIVFDGAIGRMRTEIVLDADARFIGLEMLCLGRTGSGERFSRGELSVATDVRRDGRRLWLEQGRIVGGSALLDSAVGLAGEPVCGTLIAIGPDLDQGLRDACREVLCEAGTAAVTLLPDGVLAARWLGPACEPGRAWFERVWACLRPAMTGGRAMMRPRIWRT